MFEAIYDILGLVFGPILRVIFLFVHNYGLSIILFTILCRLLMLPSALSQQKNSAKNQRMQVKIRKIQERYKGDQKRIQQETQDFYQREGYNPMSAGCSGGMLLQFPIMFGLIAAIYRPLQYALRAPKELLALLIEKAPAIFKAANIQNVDSKSTFFQLRTLQHVDVLKDLLVNYDLTWFQKISDFAKQFRFLGLDLGATPKEGGQWFYYLIPILAGLSAMISSVMLMIQQKKNNPEQKQNFAMMGCSGFMMPLFSAFVSLSFPVGIGLYWIVSSLFGGVQQIVLNYTHPPKKMLAKVLVEETILRRSRENNVKQQHAN